MEYFLWPNIIINVIYETDSILSFYPDDLHSKNGGCYVLLMLLRGATAYTF
jgi:hypothetical protein